MKNWSLGRIDFSLPVNFKYIGSEHSIYNVLVETRSLREETAVEIWENKIQKIKQIHTEAGYNDKTFTSNEIESGFPVVMYRDNASVPEQVTVEAQQQVEHNILMLKYQGKVGKEQDIIKLLSITANAYRTNIPYGFNVGAGSITSVPGINEDATVGFENKNSIEISISTQTVGTDLNSHPLDDIESEVEGIAEDGDTLKVLKNDKKVVAGFDGYEGQVSFESQTEVPIFRFTWFTPGVPDDSFKPEILIEGDGPLQHIESFRTTWENLLQSVKIRNAN